MVALAKPLHLKSEIRNPESEMPQCAWNRLVKVHADDGQGGQVIAGHNTISHHYGMGPGRLFWIAANVLIGLPLAVGRGPGPLGRNQYCDTITGRAGA
jgi:hypothetical protein